MIEAGLEFFVDPSRCIGCQACYHACAECETHRGISMIHLEYTDRAASPQTVPVVCMHCEDPACAAACPVGALTKTQAGPVVYDDARCIGCRYCMVACPFSVPKFQWDARAPYIRKCTFCADRQAAGLRPACASTCPAEAISFGDRPKLLEEARRRIAASPGRYAPEVYGERTAGGSAVLYLTAVPIATLGLFAEGFRTDLGEVPHGRYTREWMAKVPWVALGVGGLALGLYHLNQRKAEVTEQERKEG